MALIGNALPPISRAVPWAFVVLLVVTACSSKPDTTEHAQPVLVAHAAPMAGVSAAAYPGEIRARQESALAFRVGGNLVRRTVDIGDQVKRGQVLAELDPSDLQLQAQATQAQLAAARAELARATADRNRYAKLVQQQLVSRSTADAQDAAVAAAAGQVKAIAAQLDVARNAAGYAQLRAPRDGVIADRQAEAGQVVAAGQPVFTLAGDAGREVAIALPEGDIRQFRVGQPVVVELWNAPGQQWPGTIREIAPAADPQARTYAARVALSGAGAEAVELGQSARVYVLRDGNAPLAIPLSALQRGTHGEMAVWVVDLAKGTVHLKPIRTGAIGSETVPVIAGLTATDWIVAAGGHLLHEGERVSPVDRDNRPVAAASAATVAN